MGKESEKEWIYVWWWFNHLVMSDSVTPWTVPCQASLSMGFSRQEYWSGLPFPPPGDPPDPGLEPRSPALPANSLPNELRRKPKGKMRRDKLGAWD